MMVYNKTCPACKQKIFSNIRLDDTGATFYKCLKCGKLIYDSSWYHFVSEEKLMEIIETRKPLGCFVYSEGMEVVGVDNRDGDAWTEDFPNLVECLAWLLDEEDEEDDEDD